MFKSHLLKSVMFAVLATGSAAVAATTDLVNIGGHVSSSLSVAAAPTGNVATLDLSGGEKIVKIADVAMGTNNETGLTLTVTPHPLTKSGGTTITVQVTTVADTDDPPLTGVFAAGAFQVGSSASGAFVQDMYIKYTPLGLQDPGDYVGTVDLSVSDN